MSIDGVNQLVEIFYTLAISLIYPVIMSPRRLLYLLWIFTGMLIINEYNARVLSFIVEPLDEDVLRTLRQVADRNFSLVYTYQWAPAIAHGYLDNRTGIIDEDLLAMKKLLKGKRRHTPFSSFMEALALGEKTVAVTYAQSIVGIALNAAQLAKDTMARKTRAAIHGYRCFFGRRLFLETKGFIGLIDTPQGRYVSGMCKIFQRYVQSGLHFFWLKELWECMKALRVQDRNMIRSLTNLERGIKDPLSPLRLGEKVGKAFFIWSVLISVSTTLFLLELKD